MSPVGMVLAELAIQSLNELSSTVTPPLADGERQLLTSGAPVKCASTIDTLLHAPMSYATVRGLGDAACVDAVRALTLKVCAAAGAGDPVVSRIAQKLTVLRC